MEELKIFDVDAQLDAAFGKQGTQERRSAEDRAEVFFANDMDDSIYVKRMVEVVVEQTGNNLSAYIEDAPVITVGNDMKEIEDNMKEAIELYLEGNSNPCEALSGEFELKLKINI